MCVVIKCGLMLSGLVGCLGCRCSQDGGSEIIPTDEMVWSLSDERLSARLCDAKSVCTTEKFPVGFYQQGHQCQGQRTWAAVYFSI